MLALAREAGERGGTYPCAYNAANEVAVQAFLDGRIGFLEIAAARRGRARARRRRARARPRRAASRPTAARASWCRSPHGLRRGDPRARGARSSIHEAGHFFVARAVGMTPRKFYLGFGPPIVKRDARRRRVRHRRAPARRLREDPRHEPPVAGRPAADAAAGDEQAAHGASSTRSTRRSSAATTTRRAPSSPQLEPALGRARAASRSCDGALAPDAYWRQATWRRIAVIAAGPGVERRCSRSSLFTVLFMSRPTRDANVDRARRGARPAAAAGLRRRATRSSSSPGSRVKPRRHRRRTIRGDGGPAVHGSSSTRNGQRVVVGPLRAQLDQGAYRIGIEIEARDGPGRVAAAGGAGRASRSSWARHRATRRAGSATSSPASDTDQVSSSVGIVRGASQAWRAGRCRTSSSCSGSSASRSRC